MDLFCAEKYFNGSGPGYFPIGRKIPFWRHAFWLRSGSKRSMKERRTVVMVYQSIMFSIKIHRGG